MELVVEEEAEGVDQEDKGVLPEGVELEEVQEAELEEVLLVLEVW